MSDNSISITVPNREQLSENASMETIDRTIDPALERARFNASMAGARAFESMMDMLRSCEDDDEFVDKEFDGPDA